MHTIRLVGLALFALVLGLMPAATAQVNPNIEQGLRPYGSFHGGDLDIVNLANGNLFVKIPMYSLPQRGSGLKYNLSLEYNNKGFNIYTQGTCPPPKGGMRKIQYVARSTSVLNPGLSGDLPPGSAHGIVRPRFVFHPQVASFLPVPFRRAPVRPVRKPARPNGGLTCGAPWDRCTIASNGHCP